MTTAQPSVHAHTLPPDALPQLDVPLTPGGLVVGQEQSQPVAVHLFRNRQTHVGVFAAAYVAKLLAFRALAVAAQTVVVTSRPPVWGSLAQAAPPRTVLVGPPGSPTPQGGSPLRPSLVVDDAGLGEGVLRTDLGAWQTQLVLRPFVTSLMVGQLRSFDLIALQRVQPDAVPPIQQTFGLPAQTAQWLTRLPDDTIALVAAGQVRFVNLAPTQAERQLFGAPTRLDG